MSNTFQDPDSLLKFFILLATSSATDLGFDMNIKSVGETDFDLQFTIEGREYRTSRLLYDIGADAPTGRGSRAFEVVDQETKEIRVIKDCWIEDRPGKPMEHDVITGIKSNMGDKTFHEHFIDICGHRKTGMSGGFDRVCKILENRSFKPGDQFEPSILVPVTDIPKPTYDPAASVADQDHRLQSAPTKLAPEHPPHPRFRYQVVYNTKGVSLFEVTSFGDVFWHLGRATSGK